MKNELYNKYYDILKHVNNVRNITTDQELKKLSETTIINIVNKLVLKDIENKELYENILVEFNIENLNKKEEDTIDEIKTKEDVVEENSIPIEDKKQLEETDNPDEEIDNNELDNSLDKVNEYVFFNIYRNSNSEIADEFQIIMRNLNENIKNNNSLETTKNVKEYSNFVSKYNLDKDKMDIYLKQTFEKYNSELNLLDISDNNDKTKDNNVEENIEKSKEEKLKIKNIKKSYNSKLKNKALTLLALAGVSVISNPFVAAGIGVGGYYLYKKGIKNAKSLIVKNGYTLDNDDNLIDKSGKVVLKDDIGKIKYNLIRRELSNSNKLGNIDSSYKKNRLTSMLLNIPLVNKLNNKYKEIKAKHEMNEEINDMNKGMGIIR